MRGEIIKNFLIHWAMVYGTGWVAWNEAVQFKGAFLKEYPECSNTFHLREHILPRGYMDEKYDRNGLASKGYVRLNKEKYETL